MWVEGERESRGKFGTKLEISDAGCKKPELRQEKTITVRKIDRLEGRVGAQTN